MAWSYDKAYNDVFEKPKVHSDYILKKINFQPNASDTSTTQVQSSLEQ